MISSSCLSLRSMNEHPVKAFGWAARDNSGHLSPFNFSRRSTGEEDVRFKCCTLVYVTLIFTTYPLVPGHEVVGVVTEVGSKVDNFKVGDKVGVGCLVGACHSCQNCSNDLESYCPKLIGTHAPLLCAGITVYSSLRYFGLDEPGMHVGIVGLGGLGHLAVKFAKAFGCKVTVISTSPRKKKEAIEHLGADTFLVSRDADQMQAAMGTMDGIIDTVSAIHLLLPLINLLKSHGKLVMLGIPDQPPELPIFPLLMGRKTVAGSAAGGLKETQEMIDFAAKHNIRPEIEVISMNYVNIAMERLAKGDVKYRFVIDIENTLAATKS
ncbi:hypothetical protein AAG906_024093 [Vitis piasezkii]